MQASTQPQAPTAAAAGVQEGGAPPQAPQHAQAGCQPPQPEQGPSGAPQQPVEQPAPGAAAAPPAFAASALQPATDGAAWGQPAAEHPQDQGEEEEFDAELAAWLAGRLQRMQPGAELTVGSVQVLGKLLDEITVRVLEEAQRVSGGAGAPSSGAAAKPEAAAAPAAAPHPRGKQQPSALTSLDIHKALKRVLPGEPTENKLRPYLPAVTKQAWHLDKQSLKGIKRQKQAAAEAADEGQAAPAAAAAAAAAAPGGEGKENAQQAPQQAAGQ